MSREVLVNPNAGFDEWTRLVLENRRGDWWERVVKYPLKFLADGAPEFEMKRGTPLLDAEYDGAMAMRDMALMGQKWVIWISPRGGISGYPESRFCVGKVVQNRGEVVIEAMGICGDQSGEECMNMAENLLRAGGVMFERAKNFDDLRSQPIGLEMDDEKVLKLLKRVIKVEGVWEAVEDGRVSNENVRMREVVVGIMSQMPGLRRNDGYRMQLYLEQQLSQRGVRLMGGGNHGGSVMGQRGGAFDKMFGNLPTVHSEAKSDKLTECPKCHNYYLRKRNGCPICDGKN